MKAIFAFTKKEFLEMTRTSKLIVLLIIFLLFGILSPAIAKLTPMMFDMMKDQLAEQGMVVKDVAVTALTSWQQYYKNIFMELVVLLVMFYGVFTTEYQRGTLVQMLTKGLSRKKVVAAKMIAIVLIWTICHWFSFFVTYAYTGYFWDNGVAQNIFLGSTCVYLLGLWMIALIFIISALASSGTIVLMGTGVGVAVSYVLGIIPKITRYVPTYLLGAGSLVDGSALVSDYVPSLIITGVMTIALFAASFFAIDHNKAIC